MGETDINVGRDRATFASILKDIFGKGNAGHAQSGDGFILFFFTLNHFLEFPVERSILKHPEACSKFPIGGNSPALDADDDTSDLQSSLGLIGVETFSKGGSQSEELRGSEEALEVIFEGRSGSTS
ncbi:hypothetical protein SUGI_0778300 [Cryptomeria japonica]|nr:hypothetical protein SUGI_0778300 [Cryptomeria japonica]